MARENTKQQILEAALELFSEKGFEASSMSEIYRTIQKSCFKEIIICRDDIDETKGKIERYSFLF